MEDKSEIPNSNLRSILAKVSHKNSQIRSAALKRIVFKLDSDLITLSDLIHERDFILSLMEWFNQSEITQEHDVLTLLLRISEFAIPARYINSIGGVAYLSMLRPDLEDQHRSIIDRITDNLLHTSNFDVPTHNDILTNKYTELYGDHSTINYPIIPNTSDTSYSRITTPIDITPIDITQLSINPTHFNTPIIKHDFSTNTPTHILTQYDRSVIQTFIVTTRNNTEVKHDVLLSMERIFSEYNFSSLINFHNLPDSLMNLISSLPDNENTLTSVYSLNLIASILSNHKLHSNLSNFMSQQTTGAPIDIIHFFNNLISCSNSSLISLVAQECNTPILNTISVQLNIITDCIESLTYAFNKSNEILVELKLDTFVRIIASIQIIQTGILNESNTHLLVILLTGLVLITDKFSLFIRYIEPNTLIGIEGTFLYTLLDLACYPMLNLWLPKFRTYINPFLNIITADTPWIYARYLEVEDKYRVSMDLIKLLNKIRLKKSIEVHYPTVLNICQESLTVILSHNDNGIVECIVELCYWLMHEKRMGMNNDVIDVLKALLDCYRFDQSVPVTAFHKLGSLLKLELTGNDGKDFPLELVQILSSYSVILNEMDSTIWSTTWDLVFFMVTRIDNGMLFESITKWIGEFQMKATNPEMVEDIFKRFSNGSEKINLEISKVYTRYCFHRNDEIRKKAVEFLGTNLTEGVKFREESLLSCSPPVTEHKVGLRVPFHSEDVQKILSIMTSSVLDDKIRLSAFEQLCVLLQDPKLHSLMNQSIHLSLLTDNIHTNIPENVDFVHASIYSLRLLAQFNRKLTLQLSTDSKLFSSLLFWTQFSVDPIHTYNLSKLIFMMVFIHSLSYHDNLQLSQHIYNTLIIPFEIQPTHSNQTISVLDSYRDLFEYRHMRQALAYSWQFELTLNRSEYSKLTRKQVLTYYKCVLPQTMNELLHEFNSNEDSNKEQISMALAAMIALCLSYNKLEVNSIPDIIHKLLYTEISTKMQLIIFKIILNIAQPQLEYSKDLIYITETACCTKHEFSNRFKSLLEMVTYSKISPSLLLEYRDYLHLYSQLAVSLSSLPNIHSHIIYLTFFTSVITSLKHDVINHYSDIQILQKSIGKLIRPNGQAKKFLCYNADKLYITLIGRVKLVTEDVLISCINNTHSSSNSLVTDSLYNLQCTLNVLDSAKQHFTITPELIHCLTQLLALGEETLTLVLSSLSVIANNKPNIQALDKELMTIYGNGLLGLCTCLLLDEQNRSCLVREQAAYLFAAISIYIELDRDSVEGIISKFTSQHECVQSLYSQNKVKSPLTVNLSLLASLTNLLGVLITSKQLQIELISIEDILYMFIVYSNKELLCRIKLSSAITAQYELMHSLSTLLILVITTKYTITPEYTVILYRVWCLIEFTNTNSPNYLSNYKHAYALILKLISHQTLFLCQFIQLIHSNSSVLLNSLQLLLDSQTVPVGEALMPLTILSIVAEKIKSLIEENTNEFEVYGQILIEFFDSEKLGNKSKRIIKPEIPMTNGAKITELILQIISKTHPISKEFTQSDFNNIENELSVFIHWSKEVCQTLEKCGFISLLIDEFEQVTTKLYRINDKSNEHKEVILSLQTKSSLLANIFNKLIVGKELVLKQGLIEIISKLWPFTRGVESFEKSIIHLLTVLTNDNENICKIMSHPQGAPNLLNDVIKRVTYLLKHLRNNKVECKLTSSLLILIGNTCVAVECRRFLQKIGLIGELLTLLDTTREKRCKIPRLLISNTLLLLTKLNSYEDGRKIVFQYKDVLEIASEIGQEHFKDKEILLRVLFLIHNQSFHHSSKSYILSSPSILSILDNALQTQETQYMDLIGNTVSALLCKFNKGKFILKKTKLIQTLRNTTNLLSECKKENKYLSQAMLYVDTPQSEVQYN